MDVKQEIHRRVAELTRQAYERGFRDGEQSALKEIESIGAGNVIEQPAELPAPARAAAKMKPAKTKAERLQAAKDKPAPKAQPAKTGHEERGKPKSVIVQEALQTLLAEKGEARRDEILAAAQAVNPAITKHDLNNGLRALAKRSVYRVASDDSGRYLPLEATG